MPFEKILFYPLPNYSGMLVEHGMKCASHLRCHLVTHVHQLPHMRIVIGTACVVCKGLRKSHRLPGPHCICCGQHGPVDMKHTGIGCRKLVKTKEGLIINFFGHHQAFSAGLCHTDYFFKPRGTCSFNMDTCIIFLNSRS